MFPGCCWEGTPTPNDWNLQSRRSGSDLSPGGPPTISFRLFGQAGPPTSFDCMTFADLCYVYLGHCRAHRRLPGPPGIVGMGSL